MAFGFWAIVLMNMNSDAVFFGATALTAFTDNAALTYLGSLVAGAVTLCASLGEHGRFAQEPAVESLWCEARSPRDAVGAGARKAVP